MKDYNNPKDRPKPEDREIEDLKKDEVNGRRTPKKKNKDYERKYGDKYDNWN